MPVRHDHGFPAPISNIVLLKSEHAMIEIASRPALEQAGGSVLVLLREDRWIALHRTLQVGPLGAPFRIKMLEHDPVRHVLSLKIIKARHHKMCQLGVVFVGDSLLKFCKKRFELRLGVGVSLGGTWTGSHQQRGKQEYS